METEIVLEESQEQGAMHKWLDNYGQTLIYGLVAAAALLLFLFKYTASDRQQSEFDFMRAESLYFDFRAGEAEGTLGELQVLMTKYPELHQKYDGVIAQTLLARGDLAGVSMARALLEDHKSLLDPAALAFSELSLQIAKGDLVSPPSSINMEVESYPMTSSFEALRLALLEKNQGKAVQWADLKPKLSPEFIERFGWSEAILKDFFAY